MSRIGADGKRAAEGGAGRAHAAASAARSAGAERRGTGPPIVPAVTIAVNVPAAARAALRTDGVSTRPSAVEPSGVHRVREWDAREMRTARPNPSRDEIP